MAVAAGLAIAVLLDKACVPPRNCRTSSTCHCKGSTNSNVALCMCTAHHKIHHINSQERCHLLPAHCMSM